MLWYIRSVGCLWLWLLLLLRDERVSFVAVAGLRLFVIKLRRLLGRKLLMGKLRVLLGNWF